MTLDEFIANSLSTTFEDRFRQKANFEINYCNGFSNDNDNLKTKFILGESNLSVISNQNPLLLSGNADIQENGLSTKAFAIDNCRLNNAGTAFTDESSVNFLVNLIVGAKLLVLDKCYALINDMIKSAKYGELEENSIMQGGETLYNYQFNKSASSISYIGFNKSILEFDILSTEVYADSSEDLQVVNMLNSILRDKDASSKTFEYMLDYSSNIHGGLYECTKSDNNEIYPNYVEIYIPIARSKDDISYQEFVANCFNDASFTINNAKYSFFSSPSLNVSSLYLVIEINVANRTINYKIADRYSGGSEMFSHFVENLNDEETNSIKLDLPLQTDYLMINSYSYSNTFEMLKEYHTEKLLFDKLKDDTLIVNGDVIHKEKEYMPFINAVNKSTALLDYFEVNDDAIASLIDKVLYN